MFLFIFIAFADVIVCSTTTAIIDCCASNTNTGCCRNTSHILNCHLFAASELRQVAMVANVLSFLFYLFHSLSICLFILDTINSDRDLDRQCFESLTKRQIELILK